MSTTTPRPALEGWDITRARTMPSGSLGAKTVTPAPVTVAVAEADLGVTHRWHGLTAPGSVPPRTGEGGSRNR
jgi:hypothetical protein